LRPTSRRPTPRRQAERQPDRAAAQSGLRHTRWLALACSCTAHDTGVTRPAAQRDPAQHRRAAAYSLVLGLIALSATWPWPRGRARGVKANGATASCRAFLFQRMFPSWLPGSASRHRHRALVPPSCPSGANLFARNIYKDIPANASDAEQTKASQWAPGVKLGALLFVLFGTRPMPSTPAARASGSSRRSGIVPACTPGVPPLGAGHRWRGHGLRHHPAYKLPPPASRHALRASVDTIPLINHTVYIGHRFS